MFVSRPDPFSSRLISLLGRLTVLALAVFLAACSTRQAQAPRPHINYVAAEPRNFVPIPAKVELEDDGIEVQRPPVHHTNRQPDDPTEPFSPNYGAIDPDVAAMANDAEPWTIPEGAGGDYGDPYASDDEVLDGDID
ncbi:MAG: hypothetical protein ACRBCJ_07415 [Hyphomicrobiaceae bacterium]